MASVGYGFGGYGKSYWGTPQFELAESSITATSNLTAVGVVPVTGEVSIQLLLV